MARRFFRSVVLALAFLAAPLLSPTVSAQAMPIKAPERVSQIIVTPDVADVGVAREIKISGNWLGCVPVGAEITPALVFAPGTRVARLIFPQTFAPCAAVFQPYTVTTSYTPTARGIERLLVLNVDGDYLGETVVDTRASTDNRSAFNITGMWYDPLSNGSGLTFVHSRVTDNAVFGTWYIYDSAGKPRWYTIQNTEWKSQGRVMEGWLIEIRKPVSVAGCPSPFTACPATGATSLMIPLGHARVTLTGANTARVEAINTEGVLMFASDVIRADLTSAVAPAQAGGSGISANFDVVPMLAGAALERQVSVSLPWPSGCLPTGASVVGNDVARKRTLSIRLDGNITDFRRCGDIIVNYRATVYITPDVEGDLRVLAVSAEGVYLGETTVRTRAANSDRSQYDLTGMWYDPATFGSGLTFVHSFNRDDTVFGTWYVYDNQGVSRWYTIQGVQWKARGLEAEGQIYETSANPTLCGPGVCPPVAFAAISPIARARIVMQGADRAQIQAVSSSGVVLFTSNIIRSIF